jgi:hypothetical protein
MDNIFDLRYNFSKSTLSDTRLTVGSIRSVYRIGIINGSLKQWPSQMPYKRAHKLNLKFLRFSSGCRPAVKISHLLTKQGFFSQTVVRKIRYSLRCIILGKYARSMRIIRSLATGLYRRDYSVNLLSN